jgi:general secretion pathway protein H
MPISATGNKPRSAEHGFTFSGRSAEHGFTPLRRSAEHGFTLVELMVVIAIMAVASGIVALNLPESQGRVRAEAEAMAAHMLAARDDAIVQSRDMGMWVTRDGYGIERRRRGLWQPVSERPFGPVRFRDGTTAAVGTSGRERLVFDTTGAVDTPIQITIARPSGQATISVSADGTIRVGS